MLPQSWIVLAEIINFLVLVALLQRFLYKPIMRAMAQRERSIADRLQSAEVREAEAQAARAQYEQLQADWAADTKARQHQMQEQVAAERTDRIEQVRAELETQRAQWYEALHQEQKACLVNLRDRARSQLIQSIRAALNALADTTLEQQIVETFLHQLPSLSASERDSLLAAAARQPESPHWVIRTTFPLSESLQSRLVKGIQSHLPPQVPFESFIFETYPDYPCGIELQTKGYKLAWNIEHYLNSLESQLAYALNQVPVL
ncbi:ATP synthase B/B' CF(0) family [Synechococcus sp. PCC 7335]|uniref:F0F1 ATP synthase subunit B family protein n=1 Tax=Synechococcus sp. (strain ATCC 29403 / PCC 7335) TaxID=91464 RepID=UPI00017ED9D8|nr:ATP synthase B/B' CF(0) family [Synechococcus sp. PCC 7335]EDX82865.1 ATP synthase B/B' CF(0) family [Synechococcus sp. PCC 7335]